MSKDTKNVAADVDIDLSDIEVAGVEVEVAEDPTDSIEAELTETVKTDKKADKKADKKEKVEKKEKTMPRSTLPSTQPLAEGEVGASYVAELCGVDPRDLRAFLRKHFRNMEAEKSQRYHWKKDDPEIQKIVDAFKAARKSEKTVETAPKTEAAK